MGTESREDIPGYRETRSTPERNEVHPLSINLHLTARCNMSCRGCFAEYGNGTELDSDDWLRVMDLIAEETAGLFRVKANFAGGEPTLLPFLPQLLNRARSFGMVTSIITNGSILNERMLDDYARSLDWLGLSVDSLVPSTNTALGRVCGGVPMGGDRYLAIAAAAKELGLRLKINTVVSRLNRSEDFRSFILAARPDRWKLLQFLLVRGQNEGTQDLAVTELEFRDFEERHRYCPGTVVEPATAMISSYVMIDPCGRPYGNAGGKVSFGQPVQERGLLGQLKKLGYEYRNTLERRGFYY